jgi:hypothetical protein
VPAAQTSHVMNTTFSAKHRSPPHSSIGKSLLTVYTLYVLFIAAEVQRDFERGYHHHAIDAVIHRFEGFGSHRVEGPTLRSAHQEKCMATPDESLRAPR